MVTGVVGEQTEFEQWIDQLVRRFGTLTEVARVAEIGLGGMSKQIANGSLGVEPLLRLAAATGEDASVVLRRAGKADFATLIEQNYGAPKPTPPVQREVLDLLAQLPEETAEQLILPTLRYLVTQRGR